VWLFRVAELFGYDFQTILHFADIPHNGNRVASSKMNPLNIKDAYSIDMRF